MELSPHPNDIRVRFLHMTVPWQLVIPIVKDGFLTEVVVRDVRNWFFQKSPLKLIITINDSSIGDLPLIITISDTSKNQPKRLDSDNTINLSSLIVNLEVVQWNFSLTINRSRWCFIFCSLYTCVLLQL